MTTVSLGLIEQLRSDSNHVIREEWFADMVELK